MPKEKMKTIDGKALLELQLEEIGFVVDKIIPQGLHILSGAPKTGKSWFLLSLAINVSKGNEFWNLQTRQGDVLYLCLEDSLNRIQSRLYDLTEDAPDNLHFATMANSLATGLLEQIETFVKEHPDTVMIVIDTLQKVRDNSSDPNSYANDYKDIGLLKAMADKYKLSVIVVQHLRKQYDSDPHSMVTGSTGLIGAADGSMVLKKDKPGDSRAKFYIKGRDVEEQIFTIEFDKQTCLWEFICSDTPESEQIKNDKFLPHIISYLRLQNEFIGTASELCEKLKEKYAVDIKPNAIARKLHQNIKQLKLSGIDYLKSRTGERREILMTYSVNDDMTINEVAEKAAENNLKTTREENIESLQSVDTTENSCFTAV